MLKRRKIGEGCEKIRAEMDEEVMFTEEDEKAINVCQMGSDTISDYMKYWNISIFIKAQTYKYI